MAAKRKAKGAAGAIAAGQALRDNPYVHRLIEDDDLRDELRAAFESARKAYGRIDGKPQKALEDKKVQRDLKQAAESLKSAADSLREPQKRGGGFGRMLMIAFVGAALALALSEGLRKKALDAMFGAEEEYEYTASTTPSAAPAPDGAETANAS
jgi:GNAT superfamily N-acetyltransferase